MGALEASGRARNMLQRAIDGEVELRPGEVAEEIELSRGGGGRFSVAPYELLEEAVWSRQHFIVV
jgi:hypothetical protein